MQREHTSSTAGNAIAPITANEERLGVRCDLDHVLSLLSLVTHALRHEHSYQRTQRRPDGLPSILAVIDTLVQCSHKLEECFHVLEVEGDPLFGYDDFWSGESTGRAKGGAA